MESKTEDQQQPQDLPLAPTKPQTVVGPAVATDASSKKGWWPTETEWSTILWTVLWALAQILLKTAIVYLLFKLGPASLICKEGTKFTFLHALCIVGLVEILF